MTAGPSAAYWDAWYADMARSPAKDELQQRHLGLPPELLSTSLLTWDGIAVAVEALRLRRGQTLLDLACGRGGYGLEVAARTGARLVGVDVSAEAVRQAGQRSSGARFWVGELTATGLADRVVDAVLCVDAVQFAGSTAEALREVRRVLVPGGRVVLTCWEPVDRGDEDVPERLRTLDLRTSLADAGFLDVAVVDRPDWRAVERAMWQEAVSLDPGDDASLRSLHDEGRRSLETFDALRRIFAAASAP